MSERPTWLILGASSAVGRSLARAVAERGSNVTLAGRSIGDRDRTAADICIATGREAEVMIFDAMAIETHAGFAAAVASRARELNVALVFALMPEQSDIDADPAKASTCIAATFMGAVSVLHHLAPYLESHGKGVVIGFGSVAGDRGRLKNYVYGSAKAGLHTYLSGLRNRLARRGVHVMTVKPGFIDTPMTWGRSGVFLAARPDAVALTCLRAAARRRNVVYVPAFWWWIMLIVRAIPEAVFKKLSF